MSKLNPYSKSFLPTKELTNINIFDTPKDYYRDIRKKMPQRILKKQKEYSFDVGNMFDTPKDYYKQKSNDSLQFRLKTSQGKKKIFNENTNRWILDTSTSRKRIKGKLKTKKNVKFSENPIIEEFEVGKPIINPEYEQGITIDICGKYSKNISIDLNLVKSTNIKPIDLVIDLSNSINKNIQIPGYLEYNGIPLNNITYISEGSFGSVFKYSTGDSKLPIGWKKVKSKSSGEFYFFNEEFGKSMWDKPKDTESINYELAVKTYKNPKDSEISFINFLNKNNFRGSCNLINSIILKMSKKYVSIMDLMDGTLSDLVIVPIQDKINILKRSAEHMLCIKKLTGELYYTDLKSGNILYKCFKNRKMKIVIGDIGGLCFDSDNRGSSTYPTPESLHSGPNCNEATVVWDLGVTFLELLGWDTTKLFYWNSATNNSSVEFAFKCIQELEEIIIKYRLDEILIYGTNTSLSMILFEMFDPNPNKRFTLEELIDSLNNGYIKPQVNTPNSNSPESDNSSYDS